MKFNLFLLILTTFVAAVLSQFPFPSQMVIKSATVNKPERFWVVDESGTGIVLKAQGDPWKFFLALKTVLYCPLVVTNLSNSIVFTTNSLYALHNGNPTKGGELSVHWKKMTLLPFILSRT